MVLQDTWLFGGTIRDNIGYGNPDATEEQLLAAARATYVDRFVRSLPDGYDTVIDEEGSNVSAGEKQLITIARAFLADPSLLILDEATSSVDTRTEVLVQRAMAALRSDRTSFVIAHRLSTIRDADLILVMEAGRIVEQGTTSSCWPPAAPTTRLYNAQFAAAARDRLTRWGSLWMAGAMRRVHDCPGHSELVRLSRLCGPPSAVLIGGRACLGLAAARPRAGRPASGTGRGHGPGGWKLTLPTSRRERRTRRLDQPGPALARRG